MNPDLERQMTSDLEALRARYLAALDLPFQLDLEKYAAATAALEGKAALAPSLQESDRQYHIAKKFLMESVTNGSLLAAAYSHHVGAIRADYEERQRELGRHQRNEQLLDSATREAGGHIGGAREQTAPGGFGF